LLFLLDSAGVADKTKPKPPSVADFATAISRLAPLDFREIPKEGYRFQDFVQQITVVYRDRLGVVEYVSGGRGTDDEVDGVLVVEGRDFLAGQRRKWLVACRHHAHSRGAVSRGDFNASPLELCKARKAQGWLLATSTRPSASFKRLLDGLNGKGIRTDVWDERVLRQFVEDRHAEFRQFFPKYVAGREALGVATERMRASTPQEMIRFMESHGRRKARG
jgi:hypothetical protein